MLTEDEKKMLRGLGLEICRATVRPNRARINDLLVATENVFEALGVIPRASESPVEPDGLTAEYFERLGALDLWNKEQNDG